MKGDDLPAGHHWARHVTRGKISEAGVLTGAAFRWDPDGVSGNHVEHFGRGVTLDALRSVRAALRLTIKPTDSMAVFSVDALCAEAVRVVEDPLEAEGAWPPNPSHALIVTREELTPEQLDELSEALAACELRERRTRMSELL
ncbi:MAG: hypothetical protein KIT17_03870 [Rubrivivax sp.]|nr:hypothetical protein [Rubrivivax sp.]